ncbi:MAG: response regulator transcription factor [Terricaulis sp.]
MTVNAQRVLVVEDDRPLRVTLCATLRAEGHVALEAGSVREARASLAQMRPDLVVLDLGLPDADGMVLLRELRAQGDLLPVLVLTARGDEEAKVAALDAGADDYVTKPFGVPELLARVRSALRHGVQVKGAAPVITSGDVEIDLARRAVKKAGRDLRMPRREFDLLAALALQQGRPVSHEDLLREVWGDAGADIRNLRVFVGHVREKIETNASQPKLLLSEPGFGYRLT